MSAAMNERIEKAVGRMGFNRYPRASPWYLQTDYELRSTGFAGQPPLPPAIADMRSGHHSPTGEPVEL